MTATEAATRTIATAADLLREMERDVLTARDMVAAHATLARATRVRIARLADEARESKRQADADLAEAERIAVQLTADLAGTPTVPETQQTGANTAGEPVYPGADAASEPPIPVEAVVQQCSKCGQYVEQSEPLSGGLGVCDGCYTAEQRANHVVQEIAEVVVRDRDELLTAALAVEKQEEAERQAEEEAYRVPAIVPPSANGHAPKKPRTRKSR